MSSVKKKRGLFASRAHSFKENILEALKHGQVHSSSQQRKTRPDKNAIILAKKTSSTDNLTVTGHLGTAKSTDCLIKDVQFALKYFQDVVSKQTYEMLPGCATVVLETVLAIKAFASNLSDDCMDTEMCSALQNAFKAVSVLTSWADSVIIDSGHFDSQADYVESVVEPVRRAVIVAVNCISMRVGNKALARGNSLPDITNDDCDDYSFDLSQSSGSIEDIDKPPLFPKHSRQQDAPPLPPKHFKPKLDRFEDLLAHSLSLHSMEWAPSQTRNYRTLNLGRTPENSLHNKSLPSPAGLDTTLNDNSFQYSFDSPTSLSKESLTNVSFDEPDQCHSSKQQQFATRSWSSRERSNTSSPSFETLSFASHLSDLERPPAIPKKSRSICVTSSSLGVSSRHGPAISHVTPTRKLSQYDNVPDTESSQLRQQMFEFNVRTDNIHALQVAKANSLSSSSPKNVIKSPERSLSASKTTFNRVNQIQDLNDVPPPLPPKKRNIMSYMEMFGRPIFPSGDEMFEGLVHSQDLLHNVWQHNFHEYSDYTPTGLFNFPFASSHPQEFRGIHPYINVKPGDPLTGLAPALPPKRSTISSQSRPGSFRSTGSSSESERRIPIMIETDQQTLRHSQLSDSGSSSSSEVPRIAEITRLPRLSVAIPIQRICNKSEEDFQPKEDSILDRLDVSDYLVYGEQSTTNNNNNNKNVSVSLELRAGDIDALVVLATQTIKNDFLYQEAFLTTYRTFISAENLVKKLVYRFKVFNTDKILSGQRAGSMIRISRNAFSLLVRVVDTLADGDFANKPLLEMLTSFITSLVECGELGLARALRSQLIMKYEERRARLLPDLDMTSLNTVTKGTLLNFKSSEVAEQMTLLDSQLFMRLDASELLIWVQEQNEEKSMNLTKFTEHFNNMSFWCRTLILEQADAKERERYLLKFIKIMKWLRKMNNFNSYLSILSALDSAPIRRLEWHKNITEGLKEYCSLIDSSSSFRAYRLALAESNPPCIPYIGLILQDLTFVHIGNPDLFEGKISFAKRWQQFNILDNLKRFKREQYHIVRNEGIINFFGDFEKFLSEDEMWNLSETIKPRGQNKSLK